MAGMPCCQNHPGQRHGRNRAAGSISAREKTTTRALSGADWTGASSKDRQTSSSEEKNPCHGKTYVFLFFPRPSMNRIKNTKHMQGRVVLQPTPHRHRGLATREQAEGVLGRSSTAASFAKSSPSLWDMASTDGSGTNSLMVSFQTCHPLGRQSTTSDSFKKRAHFVKISSLRCNLE